MKTTYKVFAGSLNAAVLTIALVGCGGNAADTTTATAPETSAAPSASAPAMSGNTAPETASAASFKDAAATWGKVTAANAELDAVIKSGKLSAVHEAALKVRDIVRTLPAQSKSLSADKGQTLDEQVKNVEQLAGKLDEAGDSNNAAATKDNQAGLNDALDIIKGLYPAGALT